jgi:hypothetical protein
MTKSIPLVRISRRYPWAIFPVASRDAGQTRKIADWSDGDFRWLRRGRNSRRCPSFALAQRSLLTLLSPVDVHLHPLEEIQFDCPSETLGEFSETNAIREVWKTGDTFIGFRSPTGLRKYDFRVQDHWEAMFLPNGENTIEWRLGLNVEIPDECALFFCSDPETAGVAVVPGMLTKARLDRMNSSTGLSIAVKPTVDVGVRRGQPIAMMLLVSVPLLDAKVLHDDGAS